MYQTCVNRTTLRAKHILGYIYFVFIVHYFVRVLPYIPVCLLSFRLRPGCVVGQINLLAFIDGYGPYTGLNGVCMEQDVHRFEWCLGTSAGLHRFEWCLCMMQDVCRFEWCQCAAPKWHRVKSKQFTCLKTDAVFMQRSFAAELDHLFVMVLNQVVYVEQQYGDFD